MDTKIEKMNALNLDCLLKEELSSFIKTIYEKPISYYYEKYPYIR